MRPKKYAIRSDIYDELKKAYPQWLSWAEIASRLGIPSAHAHMVYDSIKDILSSPGGSQAIEKRLVTSPRHNEYRAIY